MKWVLRILGSIVALFVLVLGVQFVAAESGEVVVVSIKDAQGNAQEVRLWVVDHEGDAWLRAGSPLAGWYEGITTQPKVGIVRGDKSFNVVVQADVSSRAVVNDLMAKKYGWADQYISFLFGRDDAVPLRLEPL
ncbi:MAG: hypothetical protein GXP16_13625 [Gammaproteobacteria bacterium]|nr:hypothetical protein [Gammaproteobacteria bacterium]